MLPVRSAYSSQLPAAGLSVQYCSGRPCGNPVLSIVFDFFEFWHNQYQTYASYGEGLRRYCIFRYLCFRFAASSGLQVGSINYYGSTSVKSTYIAID